MIRYHRDVIDGVRAIGAENVRIESGGKHSKLLFTYDGTDHRATIAGTPGDAAAVRVKLRDIRRQLGLSTRPREIREEEYPVSEQEVPAVAPSVVIGTVGYYPSNHCIDFRFDKAFGDSIKATRMVAERIAEDGWELKPTETGGGALRIDSGKRVVSVSGRQIANGLPFFRATKAEYLWRGNTSSCDCWSRYASRRCRPSRCRPSRCRPSRCRNHLQQQRLSCVSRFNCCGAFMLRRITASSADQTDR